MPIEFLCSACSKRVRVPDGSEGKKCKCPACQAALEVPITLEVVEVPIDDIQIKLEVPCPKCDFVLICDPALEGTRGLCPNCKCIFTITPPGAKRHDGNHATTDEVENLQLTFAFQCPHCRQLFEGKPGMEGRNGRCIHCKEVFQIKKFVDPSPMAGPTKSASTNRHVDVKSTRSVKSSESLDGPVPVQPLFATPLTNKDWLSAIPSPNASLNPYSEPYTPYVATPSQSRREKSNREPFSGDSDSIRQRHLAHESALKGFGILFAVNAVVEAIVACGMIVFGVVTLVSPTVEAGSRLGLTLIIASIVYLLIAGVTGFVSAGLLKLNEVGRIGTVIFAALGLCAVPLGTIISAYMLYLVLSQKGVFVFSDEYKQVVRDTPHLRAYIPVFVWVLFAFFAICLFGGILLAFLGN